MEYVIFDLEWNQPADAGAAVTEPVFLEGEIIEIGAVKLDESFRLTDSLRLFVRPVRYPKMHRHIASLTGISDRDLQSKGVPFPEAFRQFRQWCGEEYAYMTWSMSDLPMLIDNMRLHGIDTGNLPVCYDIQRIFGREIMRSDTRYSLDTALSLLSEKGDTAHDALNDARNTAKVCDHLDLEQYLHEYALKPYVPEPWEGVYASRAEALQDSAMAQCDCPWCGAPVKCEPWVPMGSGTVMASGICPEEEEFLLQLTVTHHRDSFRTKRLLFDMSDDLWDIYMDKKEALGV